MLIRFLFLFSGLFFILVQSCTLSARQEEHLNEHLIKYISAHNDGRLLEVIGLTHPAVVKYYRAQGDTLFIEHFKDDSTYNKTYLGNPTYRGMKEKGKLLQRKYTVEYYSESIEINHDYVIFALSDDGGDNWFFLRDEDYRDRNIKGFKRLFD